MDLHSVILLIFIAHGAVCELLMDEYMSCDRIFKNQRTARLLDQIPCDMTTQSYCNFKGVAYPEASIWRFKEENRALMRRLYGDMESTSVYREMRATTSSFRNSQQDGGSSSSSSSRRAGGQRSGPVLVPRDPLVFPRSQYNIRVGSGLAKIEPPTSSNAAATNKEKGSTARRTQGTLKIKKRLVKKKKKQQPNQMGSSSTSSTTTATTPMTSPSSSLVTPSSTTERTTPPGASAAPAAETAATSSASTEAEASAAPSTLFPYQSDTSNTIPQSFDDLVTTTIPTVLADDNNDNDDVTRNYDDYQTTTTVPDNATTDPLPVTAAVTDLPVDEDQGVGAETPPTLYSDIFITGDEPKMASRLGDEIEVQDGEAAMLTAAAMEDHESTAAGLDSTLSDLLADVDLESLEQIIDELLPEAVPDIVDDLKTDKGDDTDNYLEYELIEEDPTNSNTPSDDNGSLIDEEEDDDGADQDQDFFTGNSVNACPVKEEVWAPYWANNTKGQTLALMNIYPFEQYVHMEVCKFEHKQMLCKKGCRCEQQYGLHRLLAFDPNNECRGIFSDWFKFPSLCICKCYNHPEDWYENLFEDGAAGTKPESDANQSEQSDDGKEETGTTVVDDKPVSSSAVASPVSPVRKTKKIRFPELNGAELDIRNIPAFLPYEAKQALLKEIRAKSRMLTMGHPDESEDEGSRSLLSRGGQQRQVRANYPVSAEETVIGKNMETRYNNHHGHHFLYGHVPIMDYQLADGSTGSIKQVPRR